jgi:serine/threonine protein kinase
MSDLYSSFSADKRPQNFDALDPELPCVLNYRFTLRRKLGAGGFGVVYEAEDRAFKEAGEHAFGRRVAIKILDHRAYLPWELERFREAELRLGRLQHPNIAAAYDAGEAEVEQAGERVRVTYLAMELLRDDVTIVDAAQGRGFRGRAELIGQVADGLNEARRQGVAHLDIKPGNVLQERGGQRVKIVDFGLSRWNGAGPTGKTLNYAAPEQISGGESGVRSDVYSLAVLAHRVFVGRFPYDSPGSPPFEDQSEEQRIETILSGRVTGVRRLDRSIPPRVERVLLKALALHPQDRYANAAVFRRDLRRAVDGRLISLENRSTPRRLTNLAARHPAITTLAAMTSCSLLAAAIAGFMFAAASRQNESLALASLETERRAVVTAERTSAFLETLVFSLDTYQARGREIDLDYLLSSAESSLASLTGDARAMAIGYSALGRVAANRQEFDRGVVWLREASRLWEEVSRTADNDSAAREALIRRSTALNHLAWALAESGNAAAAIDPASNAYELRRSLEGESDEDTLAFRFDLGQMQIASNDVPSGLRTFLAGLAVIMGVEASGVMPQLIAAGNAIADLDADGQREQAKALLRTTIAPFLVADRPRIRARVPWSLAQAGEFVQRSNYLLFFGVPNSTRERLGPIMAEVGHELALELKPKGHPDIEKTSSLLARMRAN